METSAPEGAAVRIPRRLAAASRRRSGRFILRMTFNSDRQGVPSEGFSSGEVLPRHASIGLRFTTSPSTKRRFRSRRSDETGILVSTAGYCSARDDELCRRSLTLLVPLPEPTLRLGPRSIFRCCFWMQAGSPDPFSPPLAPAIRRLSALLLAAEFRPWRILREEAVHW